MCVPTLDDVLLLKPELAVILVEVIFIDSLRQATDDDETTVPINDPACSVEDLLRFVSGQFG